MANKKTEKEATTEAQTTAPATAPNPQANDLNVADLKNISLIIDLASSRGAFRANEMATVGMVYNKLQSFLTKIAPPAETAPGQTATQETTAPTAAPSGK